MILRHLFSGCLLFVLWLCTLVTSPLISVQGHSHEISSGQVYDMANEGVPFAFTHMCYRGLGACSPMKFWTFRPSESISGAF